MIFYLHYILLTGGMSNTAVLLGVFVKNYSDASQSEIGLLMMSIPFMSIITKPLFCALADRHLAHRSYLVLSLLFMLIGFSPLMIIPFFPSIYQAHARFSLYALVTACHMGCAGLNVAWSLGETLAVNYAHRTGTAYSRMRLMGTLSWGVYGYAIGMVNEVSFLPKYVPAFIILSLSVLIEIILILIWSKEDFIMVDSATEKAKAKKLEGVQSYKPKVTEPEQQNKFQDVSLEWKYSHELEKVSYDLSNKLPAQINSNLEEQNGFRDLQSVTPLKRKNPQLKLFKMILTEDGRVIKYFILFALCGIIFSPIGFVFMSFEDVCKKKDCSFSYISGLALVSQAGAETVTFFVMPWILARISKRTGLLIALIFWAVRYLVYSLFYYTDDFSPYWALALECCHGIAYGFFATVLADVAYSTSNLSELFIPELRKLKYLSDTKSATQEQIETEEYAIKMALRATMMAITNSLWEGLGFAVGNLLCAVLVEICSYSQLWFVFTGIGLTTLIAHQLIEFSGSRWSDAFKPKEGTKAYEIMNIQPQVNEKKSLAH